MIAISTIEQPLQRFDVATVQPSPVHVLTTVITRTIVTDDAVEDALDACIIDLRSGELVESADSLFHRLGVE